SREGGGPPEGRRQSTRRLGHRHCVSDTEEGAARCGDGARRARARDGSGPLRSARAARPPRAAAIRERAADRERAAAPRRRVPGGERESARVSRRGRARSPRARPARLRRHADRAVAALHLRAGVTMAPPKAPLRSTVSDHVLETPQVSVLDLVDELLNKGVMANADVTLGVAGIDLIYLRLSALLCAADRVLPAEPNRPAKRRRHRRR